MKAETGIRQRGQPDESRLPYHFYQGSLPFLLGPRGFGEIVGLGKDLDREVSDLNNAHITSEVYAVIAHSEELIAMPLIVLNQALEVDILECPSNSQRRMLKNLKRLTHKWTGSLLR